MDAASSALCKGLRTRGVTIVRNLKNISVVATAQMKIVAQTHDRGSGCGGGKRYRLEPVVVAVGSCNDAAIDQAGQSAKWRVMRSSVDVSENLGTFRLSPGLLPALLRLGMLAPDARIRRCSWRTLSSSPCPSAGCPTHAFFCL